MYRESFIALLLPICLICGGFPISVSAQNGPNDAVAEPGDVVSFTFSDGITTNSDYFYWVKYSPQFTTIYAQNGTQPVNSTKYNVINNESFTLIVKAVTEADAVTYCFYSSKTKETSCANLLVIEYIIAMVYPSNGLSVGQVAKLICEVQYQSTTTDDNNTKPLSQDQVPQLSMYVGNTQITNLPPAVDFIGSDQMAHIKSVSINRTILTSDVGQYVTCKVTTKNPQFNLSSSTLLKFAGPTENVDVYYVINAKTNPTGACCRVNDTLTCFADGYPYPTFMWTTTNGLTLMPSRSGNGYSSLLITIVGTYTVICSAKNNMSSIWLNDTITFNSLTGFVNGSSQSTSPGVVTTTIPSTSRTTTITSASRPTVISSLLLFFIALVLYYIC